MKIAVLHDEVKPGAAPDSLDNLQQAKQVSRLLKKLGHAVRRVPFTEKEHEISGNLLKQEPDLVFNLVEAPQGQGRLIHLAPRLMERLGIGYTGSGIEALLNTGNKLWAKTILGSAGLPTPDWFHPDMTDIKGGGFQPHAYILKSVWEHASFGMDQSSVVDCVDPHELTRHLAARCEQHGGDWFAERFISGREFNLSLIGQESGPQILPPAEIVFRGFSEQEPHIVDYAAKWNPQSPHYDGTERRFDFGAADADLLQQLKDIAGQCWRLFDLRGWARVDFRVDEWGRPWVLEVNANPCLALDAGFMAAVKRAGYKPEQAINLIVQDTQSDQADQAKIAVKRSANHAGGNGQDHAYLAQVGLPL